MKANVKEAYDLIVLVTGKLNGTREDHLKIQSALNTIFAELEKEKK